MREDENNTNASIAQGAYCPIPLPHQDQIVIGHGSGGKMTHDLIRRVFREEFSNDILDQSDDGAILGSHTTDHDLVVSVDSHVVTPIFFPGGDIGRLAISGTVNDISVMGAKPLYITAGFILEEGLQIDILQKIIKSMKLTAEEAGVKIVAGDTKVVEKGKADTLFITTTGVGYRDKYLQISGNNVQVGDDIILSGTIGDHGMAILQARGDLGLESSISSDVAPLNMMIHLAIEAGKSPNGNAIHAMRDPTRGGLATTLNEIAQQSNVGILIYENSIPISPAVSSMCEMLGFDPLYVANEGKCILFVEPTKSQDVLKTIRSHKLGSRAEIIGKVIASPNKKVLMKTLIGSTRIVDMLSGEMLPRIC